MLCVYKSAGVQLNVFVLLFSLISFDRGSAKSCFIHLFEKKKILSWAGNECSLKTTDFELLMLNGYIILILILIFLCDPPKTGTWPSLPSNRRTGSQVRQVLMKSGTNKCSHQRTNAEAQGTVQQGERTTGVWELLVWFFSSTRVQMWSSAPVQRRAAAESSCLSWTGKLVLT